MSAKRGFTYIMTNYTNQVLYTGVTSDIYARVIQHKEKHYPNSFTAKYNCNKLVYFEFHDSIMAAIEREKYIKGKNKAFKKNLIESSNRAWEDLWEEVKNW